MRKFVISLCIFGLLLAMILPGNEPERIATRSAPASVGSDTWSQLRLALNNLRDSPLSTFVAGVERDLPSYQQLTDTEFAAVTSSITLDVIGMAHLREDDSIRNQVNRSQDRIDGLLNTGNYTLVALEGSYGDRMQITDVYREIYDGIRAIDPAADEQRIKLYFENDVVGQYAALRYLRDHPFASGVGIEVRALHNLHDNFIAMAERMPHDARFDTINNQISNARSDIAVARMLAVMRRFGVKKGALVIGIAHIDRIRQLFLERHINGQIIGTVD